MNMESTAVQDGKPGTAILRRIARIDHDLCNGCAACVLRCRQGALEIVEGRAVLIAEELCDGLGFCAGACPRNAIDLEDRYAAPFRGDLFAIPSRGVEIRDSFHRRLSICCRATEGGRICRRLVKQPGKTAVWCVDTATSTKAGLYEALARSDFHCPEGRF